MDQYIGLDATRASIESRYKLHKLLVFEHTSLISQLSETPLPSLFAYEWLCQSLSMSFFNYLFTEHFLVTVQFFCDGTNQGEHR